VFTSPAYFNIGAEGLDPVDGSLIYGKFGGLALTLHESFPGHGQQVPLAQEVDCKISPNSSAPTSFVEGWALYTEQFGYWLNYSQIFSPKGLYGDPAQELGYFNANMLRSTRLVEDTGIHYFGWSYDQSWEYMNGNGFLSGMSQSETKRYIAMPAQALGYMLGKLKINEMRNETQSDLGGGTGIGKSGLWDPVEFNMLLTKFGGGTMSDLENLVNTYILYKMQGSTGSGSLEGMFGYDMVSQMFSSCLPVVGYGRTTV